MEEERRKEEKRKDSMAGDGGGRDIDDIEAEQRRRADLKDELLAR